MKTVLPIGRRASVSCALACVIGLSALASGAQAATPAATLESGPDGAKSAISQSFPLGDEAVPVDGKPDLISAKAEIIVLHATNEGTGIDPKIGKIPALEQPPFSSYNSYKLLDRAEVQLDKGAAQDRTLADGAKLTVALKDIERSKEKGASSKFVISMSIERDGKSFLPSLEVNAKQSEYFFVAGQKYKGGILVIGIRIL